MSEHEPPKQHVAIKKLVPRMLAFIGQAHYEREKGIGGLVGVTQPTISRWMSGKLLPDDAHLTKIVTTFHEACAHIRALFPVPANLHYLCSFAPKYSEDRANEAEQALKDSVLSIMSSRVRKPSSIQIDLHIRAASLQNNARAHCFVEDLKEPKVFLVLVSNTLSFREQHVVAFDEAYAHVMNKLIDRANVVEHPTPFI
jgi:predicted XRE-type DNA-binding protein